MDTLRKELPKEVELPRCDSGYEYDSGLRSLLSLLLHDNCILNMIRYMYFLYIVLLFNWFETKIWMEPFLEFVSSFLFHEIII